MTSSELTAAGFGLILAVAAAVELLAHARRISLPTIDQTLARVRRSPRGRVAVLFVWFWLGWHFLAR